MRRANIKDQLLSDNFFNKMKSSFLLTVFTASVYSHMEMFKPAPRKSQFNPYAAAQGIDYNIMAPLAADGSDFPCKKYPKGQATSTYNAGETITVELKGSATHGGGNCQISISYNDVDFVAISTILKNCLHDSKTITATIPADAPACESCTLSWSWVNAIGNREFYQNCADIKINNPSGGRQLTGPRMTVLNLPNYPRILEMNQEPSFGERFYQNASNIAVGPGAASGGLVVTNPPLAATPPGQGTRQEPQRFESPPAGNGTGSDIRTMIQQALSTVVKLLDAIEEGGFTKS
jgi:hypothetical protein